MPISENNKPILTRFFGVVRKHEWNQLNDFKDWDSTADNLVAYAMKGSHESGVIIVLKDVFELYEQDELVLQETLSPTEMLKVSEVAALKWQPISLNLSLPPTLPSSGGFFI
jgi:hypothetical protein